MQASMRLWLGAFLLVTSGCTLWTSADGELLCTVMQRVPAGEMSRSEHAAAISAFLDENMRSDDGREVMDALVDVPLASKGGLLRDASRKLGYDGACPTADALDWLSAQRQGPKPRATM